MAPANSIIIWFYEKYLEEIKEREETGEKEGGREEQL